MPSDVLLLVVTALLAAVALVAAVVAVRAARRPARTALSAATDRSEVRPQTTALVPFVDARSGSEERRQPATAPRHVDGRVVVPPTRQQVVNTALSRPQVRVGILVHGLAHALRAESRDRVAALMRREYRRRRRERLAAGRRAVRSAQPSSSEAWVVEPWIAEIEPGRPSLSATKVER